jgi:dihydroorotase
MFMSHQNYLIKNVTVVNENTTTVKDVYIKNGRFEKIDHSITIKENAEEINGEHLLLMPGVIDDQVHFREPGLTHKATIQTEAAAAVAGGTTSFMEMPNVIPASLTMDLLEQKYAIANQKSLANYSFFMGVSNDNVEEALKINKRKNDICGLKIFMGSSTGNMLVDNIITLEKIFGNSEVLIATHCESEPLIRKNTEQYIASGNTLNHARQHPIIRNDEVCYESSIGAIQLAKKFDTRLHILHISTELELQLFTNLFPLKDKRITSEVCVHHLTFTADDYEQFGNLIKCNPAIKAKHNKEALWQALLDDRLDIIATDHAPHTWDEKNKTFTEAPSGIPLVQHSLLQMLDHVNDGRLSIEKMVEKMCHTPAICFDIKERGYIREGYFADAVLVDRNKKYTVTKDNILYKCGWSPFENKTFESTIDSTFVSGVKKYHQGKILTDESGIRLEFERG